MNYMLVVSLSNLVIRNLVAVKVTDMKMNIRRSENATFLMVCCHTLKLSRGFVLLLIGLTDDLPVIRDNIRKGFIETQTKVNAWVQTFKKKLDGDEEDEEPASSGYLQSHGETQTYGRARRSVESTRRSGDRERYDADPQVLGDDFSALELRDSEGCHPLFLTFI